MADLHIQKPPPAAMAQPNQYIVSQRPSTASSLNSSGVSSGRSRFLRLRYLLTVLAIIITIIIAISLVFVAHVYYHEMGGQGFLKKRDIPRSPDTDLSSLFLPLRKIESAGDAREDDGKSLLPYLPWNTRSLGPGQNVPYYTCGDQQSSCEAYDQPVCCSPSH